MDCLAGARGGRTAALPAGHHLQRAKGVLPRSEIGLPFPPQRKYPCFAPRCNLSPSDLGHVYMSFNRRGASETGGTWSFYCGRRLPSFYCARPTSLTQLRPMPSPRSTKRSSQMRCRHAPFARSDLQLTCLSCSQAPLRCSALF